jgi:hypothetical protein
MSDGELRKPLPIAPSNWVLSPRTKHIECPIFPHAGDKTHFDMGSRRAIGRQLGDSFGDFFDFHVAQYSTDGVFWLSGGRIKLAHA